MTLRGPDGRRYPARLVKANLADPTSFHQHLLGIAQIEVADVASAGQRWPADYELEIRSPADGQDKPPLLTLRGE